MPRIVFDRVVKSFGDVEVLKDFSVTVADGEFLVLLGPSGCGKSTLLRMIAGLADVTSGTIAFDGAVINDWDVRQREVAFVFQSYALYPQMTVRQNIAFPLLMDRFKSWHHLPVISFIKRRQLLREPAIRDKIDAIAEQLKLTSLLDRRPAKLSGGQRQRVALARSLVREPSLYLLDEPLSNLDAKLRTQMRTDITALHRAVEKTFIYVTHDQVEAMTMATTIIVLDNGVIQQVGTPDEIYDRPKNTFVATFVGSPPMNLIEGTAFVGEPPTFPAGATPPLSSLIAGIRPEHLKVAEAGATGLQATIEVVERVGAETLIGCRMSGPVEVNDDALPSLVFVSAQAAVSYRVGDACSLQATSESISWFDKASGERFEFSGEGSRAASEAADIESGAAVS